MQPNGNTPGAARPVAGAPVNNANTVPTSMPTPKPEPAFGNGESVVEGKGNKKAGWILAIVFLLIVAAGGVGFGVWAMMDGNTQKDALNSQISALKQQNSELQDKLDNGGDTIINIDNDSSTGVWNNFVNSLSDQHIHADGWYWHSDGSRYLMQASIGENQHLVITDNGGSNSQNPPVVLELDGVLAVYFASVGNGGVPYFYIIMADKGEVYRVDISENSSKELESVGDYNKIVTVLMSSLNSLLVDIDGNAYKVE